MAFLIAATNVESSGMDIAVVATVIPPTIGVIGDIAIIGLDIGAVPLIIGIIGAFAMPPGMFDICILLLSMPFIIGLMLLIICCCRTRPASKEKLLSAELSANWYN